MTGRYGLQKKIKVLISDLSDYCLRIHLQRFLYKLLSENSFQTILTNYYHRNHCNQFLQTIIREIILKNSQKLFSR